MANTKTSRPPRSGALSGRRGSGDAATAEQHVATPLLSRLAPPPATGNANANADADADTGVGAGHPRRAKRVDSGLEEMRKRGFRVIKSKPPLALAPAAAEVPKRSFEGIDPEEGRRRAAARVRARLIRTPVSVCVVQLCLCVSMCCLCVCTRTSMSWRFVVDVFVYVFVSCVV